MKLLLRGTLAVFLFSCSISGQDLSWFNHAKGIEVLKSTREEIFKVFGPPDNPTNPHWHEYKLKTGAMTVEYSTGLCSPEKRHGWNIPEFTVTRIFFTPSIPLTLKDLRFDPKGFNKREIDDVPDAFLYDSEKHGISYTLKRNGNIEIVDIYPAHKFNHLFCNKTGVRSANLR